MLTVCSKLNSLGLPFTHITDNGLRMLAFGLRELTCLDLSNCPGITDDGLGWLLRCPLLSNLRLAYCGGLTDVGLRMLVTFACPQLRNLTLTGCRRITDIGLGQLANHPTLAFLKITRCSGITDAGIEEFSSVRPEIRLIR